MNLHIHDYEKIHYIKHLTHINDAHLCLLKTSIVVEPNTITPLLSHSNTCLC